MSERASSPALDRRGMLGLLPVVVAACAAPARPAPAASTSAPRDAADDLVDRVVVRVIDTEGSLGPRARAPREVRIRDLVTFHGHPCDGLMIAARGVALGLAELFGDAPVDRTDLAAATNASVCYGDVVEHLTGARHRYGSMVLDAKLGDEWHVLRRATGEAVRVSLLPGVKPARLVEREASLRGGGCSSELISEVVALQRELGEHVWRAAPGECFRVERVAYGYPLGTLRSDVSKRDCPLGARSNPGAPSR